MTVQAEQEVFSFQAEAAQILDLMVHSLYSNKEIFLRELISNASDAIDRLRLELLSRSELPEAEGPLRLRVSYDKDAGTITVADNGIGMSRDEVIANIGTIAKSGTREFLRSLTGDARKDAALIGQFGVGFYSSFIVAERVDADHPAGGPGAGRGGALGIGRQGRVHAGDDRTGRPGHHDRAAPAGRRGRPAERVAAAVDHREVLRPHQRADPDARRARGQGRGRTRASRNRT